MLTLIPMMLVDRTVPAAPALVGQVSAHRPLEEALATYKIKIREWIIIIYELLPAN